MTASVEKSIDVDVPVRTAYNQWTQFETFPEFMEGVVEVKQLSDTTLHWKAKVAGTEKEWDATITEQQPDERIAWKAVDGAPNAGVVTFHRLSDDKARVMLQLEAEPEGFIEEVGDKLGVFNRRVEADLKRFKEYVESRGSETGAWRGEVKQPTS
ncbi:MAG: SRPBCC family protein [Candidatus Dormibacteraeota bacterium]|uniref:Cyclase n=1 Tax=Candidatus Aeolococcus gillhamiae TaxID=3127015 RepID=A0A2W6B1I4_9BACT|nr:SRPBCC family protein [Candidatus Dormibacteraeota bacterium]PZR84291.1 MAG: cyclase [Candidatus Dormibacter sp. RRmetagenome_bin12]